ncbi:MAG: AAA family ATPase [Candidatus Pacearchaeota archaeon]
MKLKKIGLKNIRSYADEEIAFNEGSTLLAGDIGSGKTTVLLALEFGLFGLQPGQRGSSLLKNGENEGSVTVEIEIDGQEILIERTLKRSSKSVSQDYASITIDGNKEELAVSELKNKVLDLLQYPKEFSKKQNLLYKFTVYTPQEEMKQIIMEDSSTRVNTLRHIFGIDKYKKILENSNVVLSKIREEKRHKQGEIADLDEYKRELEKKQEDLKAMKEKLEPQKQEYEEKKKSREKVQSEKEELEKKREEKQRLNNEIEKTKMMISTKQSSISENQKQISQLEEQIAELQKIKFDQNEIKSLNEEIDSMQKKKRELNDRNVEISSRLSSLQMKNQENFKVKEKLKHIEVCPTCMQDVNEEYKKNVVDRMEQNNERNNEEIKKLKQEKENISKQIEKIDEDVSIKQKKIQELERTKMKLENLDEKKKKVEEIKQSNESLNKDIEMLNQQIESLKSNLLEMSKYDSQYEEKKKDLEKASEEERKAEIKVAELNKEISLFENQIEEIKKKIENKEEIRKRLGRLVELEEWINKQFISMVSNVEKNVMNKLKSEFSRLFSDWFSMLVPENFNVTLDDNFSPVIEYQEYIIDYPYLSGGEKNAIALAYRLALNQVINSVLSNIKTKGFIILDEPTDGFSDTQLDKMRNVLDQMEVEQLIIVSHEPKIEGFVENVIKFRKENGMSIVEEKNEG